MPIISRAYNAVNQDYAFMNLQEIVELESTVRDLSDAIENVMVKYSFVLPDDLVKRMWKIKYGLSVIAWYIKDRAEDPILDEILHDDSQVFMKHYQDLSQMIRKFSAVDPLSATTIQLIEEHFKRSNQDQKKLHMNYQDRSR